MIYLFTEIEQQDVEGILQQEDEPTVGHENDNGNYSMSPSLIITKYIVVLDIIMVRYRIKKLAPVTTC